MNPEHHKHSSSSTEVERKGPGSPLWQKCAIIGAVAIVLFYLLAEHRAHFFGALPYLLILACPLLHFFMHGKHGGRSPEHRKDNR